MKRGDDIGSDHFPIYIELYLDYSAQELQEEPDASLKEEEWIDEKIDDANPEKIIVKE